MFAMPSGRTLIAGPAAEDSWFLNSVNQNPFTWSPVANLRRQHSWGTTVLLPGGAGGSTKVMALGGSNWTDDPSSPAAEMFDESNAGPGWQVATSNVIGRGHANTVLLPDGSMVEVGGGRGKLDSFQSPLHAATDEQRQIELWDPVTRDWQLGPAQTESRAYHSTALLLPDGRVMSAGDEYNGDHQGAGGANLYVDDAEIYKPPYLFQGPRPTITSNLTDIKVGAAFGVNTPDTNIRSAALVAPAAVTHGVDMNQRVIQLDVIRRSGCVSITAPSANVAPPGPYMLFLLNDQGVPSVADFVKLQTGGDPAGLHRCRAAHGHDRAHGFDYHPRQQRDGVRVGGGQGERARQRCDRGRAVQGRHGQPRGRGHPTAVRGPVELGHVAQRRPHAHGGGTRRSRQHDRRPRLW